MREQLVFHSSLVFRSSAAPYLLRARLPRPLHDPVVQRQAREDPPLHPRRHDQPERGQGHHVLHGADLLPHLHEPLDHEVGANHDEEAAEEEAGDVCDDGEGEGDNYALEEGDGVAGDAGPNARPDKTLGVVLGASERAREEQGRSLSMAIASILR